jgi:hypothetical protein
MMISYKRQFPAGLIYAVVAAFSIFSIAGCSAGNTATQSSQHAAAEVPTYKYISHSREKVYRAIEKNLYNRGYVITSRNDLSGTISAERYTTSPIDEDQSQPASTGPTAGQVILMILGIVLIVGLIAMLVDSSSKNDSSSKKDHHDDGDHHGDYDDHSVPATIGYRYIMEIRTTAVADTATRVEINMTKVVIENGTPTSSAPVRSSSTLKIFFESLENELYFTQ